jgi:translation initiation factor 3 subunit K
MNEQQEQIHKLLTSNRYDANIIPELEKYVKHQIETNSYDLEANLALLKLYQFNPEKTNTSVVSQILIKAMMNLPSSDFLLCMCLVSDKCVSNFTSCIYWHSIECPTICFFLCIYSFILIGRNNVAK